MRKRSLLLIALNVLFINGCNVIPSLENSEQQQETTQISYNDFIKELESYDVELYNDFKVIIKDSGFDYLAIDKYTDLESGLSRGGNYKASLNNLNASLALKGLKEASKASLVNGELLANGDLSIDNFYGEGIHLSNKHLDLSMYLKDSKMYGSFNDEIKNLLDPNNEGNTWPQKFYFDVDESVDEHIGQYVKALGLTFPLVSDINFSYIKNNLYNTLVNNLAIAVSPNLYGIYKIESSSMEDTIEMGGYVVVDYNSKDYQVGDIISYHKDNNVYTHRIVTINDDGSYITKGDANSMPNIDPVYYYEIVGEVIEIYPANTKYSDITDKYGIEKKASLIKKGINLILDDLLKIEKIGDKHSVSLKIEKESLSNKFNEVVDKLYNENIFSIFEGIEINNEFINELKANFASSMNYFSNDSYIDFSMNLEKGLVKSLTLDGNIIFNMKREAPSFVSEQEIKANLHLSLSFDYQNDLVINYPDFSSYKSLGE